MDSHIVHQESKPTPVKHSSAHHQKASVPSFISKTFDILDKQEHLDIISWSDNGRSFYVQDIKAFEQKILPLYFRHKNFPSFVRQLNMYDFHKIRGEQKHIFEHKLFQRHSKHLLSQIRRKGFKKPKGESDNESEAPETPQVKRSRATHSKVPPTTEPPSSDDSSEEDAVSFDEGIKVAREQELRKIIEEQERRKKEEHIQLVNEIVEKLKMRSLQSEKEIRQEINQIRRNPRYKQICGKRNLYDIYKKLKQELVETCPRPRRTLEDLDELSIEEDILYNEIERPSRFKIVSLTNFQTENFMLKSSREVMRGMAGQEM